MRQPRMNGVLKEQYPLYYTHAYCTSRSILSPLDTQVRDNFIVHWHGIITYSIWPILHAKHELSVCFVQARVHNSSWQAATTVSSRWTAWRSGNIHSGYIIKSKIPQSARSFLKTDKRSWQVTYRSVTWYKWVLRPYSLRTGSSRTIYRSTCWAITVCSSSQNSLETWPHVWESNTWP